MDEAASLHPSPEQLFAYGLGKLDGGEHDEVERHVSQCDSCCAALREVSADGLLKKLREADSVAGDETIAHRASQTAAKQGSDEIPQQLREHPKFRVLQKLGGGGMGVVYKAEHRLMKRLVALKVINPWLLNHPDVVGRFQREVRAASKLNHPNIVTALDAERAGDLHLLVMEFVEGASLDRVVASRGPLSIADTCDYIRQVAEGLQHAHEHDMVHRDIKPQNLVWSRNGRVRILDFGLARLSRAAEIKDPSLTSAGIALGTPDYIAPEQARDSRDVDVRADIYSLGCTLFFLLTGQPPFPNRSTAEKLAAHLEHAPPRLSSLRDDIPVELCAVVERMMAKDPADRFQTPVEVVAALETVGSTPSAAPAAPPPPTRITASFVSAAPQPNPPAPTASPSMSALPVSVNVRPAGTAIARSSARRNSKRRNHLVLTVATLSVLAAIGLTLTFLLGRGDLAGRQFSGDPGGSQLVDNQKPSRQQSTEGGDGFIPESPLGSENTEKNGRVLIVLPANNFWGPEYEAVFSALSAARYDVEIASSVPGFARTENQQVKVDLLLKDADSTRYDAVYFCGAEEMADNLEFARDGQHLDAARKFINQMLASRRYVASMCAGTAVLAKSGVLTGERTARVEYVTREIKEDFGIEWVDQPVVRTSELIITGGDPTPEILQQFSTALLDLLKSD